MKTGRKRNAQKKRWVKLPTLVSMPGTPFREDVVSSLLEKTRADYNAVCDAVAQLEI